MRLRSVMLTVVLAMLTSTAGWSKGKTFVVPQQNVIEIKGVVDTTILAKADQIEKLSAAGVKEITLIINSPGGSVVPGIMFIDAMEVAKARGTQITCMVTNVAASMAMHILGHCSTRYALPHSFLLWHPAKISVFMASLSAKDLEAAATALHLLEDELNDELLESLQINEEIFWYCYGAELLIPAIRLQEMTPSFIKIVKDVKGAKDLFGFGKDDQAAKAYQQLIRNSQIYIKK
jgi:ATP-dependent protease ClpP protease subunit